MRIAHARGARVKILTQVGLQVTPSPSSESVSAAADLQLLLDAQRSAFLAEGVCSLRVRRDRLTRAIDLLRSLGYHELVSRSMVVLNDSRGKYDPEARKYLTERFGQSGATVEFMPYDEHLAKGGIIDVQNE